VELDFGKQIYPVSLRSKKLERVYVQYVQREEQEDENLCLTSRFFNEVEGVRRERETAKLTPQPLLAVVPELNRRKHTNNNKQKRNLI